MKNHNRVKQYYLSKMVLKSIPNNKIILKRSINWLWIFLGLFTLSGWFTRDVMSSPVGKPNIYGFGFFILGFCLLDYIYGLTFYKVIADGPKRVVILKPGMLNFTLTKHVFDFAQINNFEVNDCEEGRNPKRIEMSFNLKTNPAEKIILLITDNTQQKYEYIRKFTEFVGKPMQDHRIKAVLSRNL